METVTEFTDHDRLKELRAALLARQSRLTEWFHNSSGWAEQAEAARRSIHIVTQLLVEADDAFDLLCGNGCGKSFGSVDARDHHETSPDCPRWVPEVSQ